MKRLIAAGIVALGVSACAPAPTPAPPNYSSNAVVSTLAGSAGQQGAVDGSGSEARFALPVGSDLGPDGNLYIADDANRLIRRVTPAGEVTTVAGVAGEFAEVDGPAATAKFAGPADVAVDAVGNVYVADVFGDTIRKITPDGVVSTLAGVAFSEGDSDSPNARFNSPSGIDVDANGNVYVADQGNHRIRRIDPDGTVTTVAGGSNYGSTNGPALSASFQSPSDVVVAPDGTLFIADWGNSTIRKLAGGQVSTVAGFPRKQSWSDGVGAAASFDLPNGIALDSSGNLYVADTNNHLVRKVTPAGVVTTLAGFPGQSGSADGVGIAARFDQPPSVAVTPDGSRIYVVDGDSMVRTIDIP